MKKREFIKILGVTGAVAATGSTMLASDKKGPGQAKEEWKDEPSNKHSPVLTSKRNGDNVDITIDVTKHPQTAEHFIKGVLVYDDKKKQLFNASLDGVKGVSKVTCTLKLAKGTKVTGLSSCNKHGFYKSDHTV